MIVFDVQLEKQDIAAMARHVSSKRAPVRFWSACVGLGLVLSAALAAFFEGLPAAGVMAVVGATAMFLAIRDASGVGAVLQRVYRYQLDPSGMSVTEDEHVTTHIGWRAITDVVEGPDHFFLMRGRLMGNIIPKRCISDSADQLAFRTLIQPLARA